MVQRTEQTPGHAGPGPACGASIGPALTNANCPIDTALGKLSIAATTVDIITIWILVFISSPRIPDLGQAFLSYRSFLTSVNLFPNIHTDKEPRLRPDRPFGSLIPNLKKPTPESGEGTPRASAVSTTLGRDWDRRPGRMIECFDLIPIFRLYYC
jgi:hypothetical protein